MVSSGKILNIEHVGVVPESYQERATDKPPNTIFGPALQQSPSPRRESLLAFVSTLSPSSENSGFDVPAPVLAAMRQTVSNLLGTLPPQYFRVTISTRGDNLAQLMFSVLMTGYMFCNAWYRIGLSQSLGMLGLPDANGRDEQDPALVGSGSASYGSIDDEMLHSVSSNGMAAGSQKLRVEGEVLRWHHENGVQQVTALEYMEQLEAECAGLRRELSAQKRAAAAAATGRSVPSSYGGAGKGKNELLEYLKMLSPDQVAELTDCATPDVLDAMNALVCRLIGDDGEDGEWGRGKSECTATELGHLLYFLLVVGHELRDREMRLSLNVTLDVGRLGGPDDGANGPGVAPWVPRLPPPKR